MSNLQRFEGPDLDALLDEVRQTIGPDAAIVEANKVRNGGIGGFFAREHFEVVVDLEATDGSPESDAADVSDLADVDEPAPATDLLALVERVSDEERAAHAHAPTPDGPDVSTEREPFAAVLQRLTDDLRAPAPPDDDPLGTLARLGTPGSAPHDAERLLQMLASVPRPEALPEYPGSLVATVGPRDRALALARALADELGVDTDEILLATPGYRGRAIPADRRIVDAGEAAERRLSRRRKRKVSVVAVEAPPTAEGARWASKVLDALEPTMTWATVEAMRKAEDIAAWCAEIGVVDALDVTGTDETVTPAAVLLAGVPIGRLDGRAATTGTWAGVLARGVAA